MTGTRWAVLDCGKFPSENNCKIKLSAPEEQVEKLVDLAVYHACQNHGHQDTQEFRNQLKGAVEFEDASS